MDKRDAHASPGDVEKNGTFYLEDVSKVESVSPAGSGQVGDVGSEEEPKMTVRRFMPFVAMAFLWTGSQIPLYLYGAIPPYIYGDIGGIDRWVWFVLANLLALAAVCPFVGSLSDLFGRRYTAIIGAVFLIVGNIVTSTCHTMNIFICGMALAGIGAGILELTALAVTSEIAPTRKRGKYNAWMILTIVPFCPSVLWGQWVAHYGSWRWIGFWCAMWAFIGLVLTVIFYHPPPRSNTSGLSRREVLKRIDYVGGFLSISGLLLFMAGLQWGGYNYPWTSAHTLVPLFIGVALIIAFLVWEWRFATYPMFPSSIKQEPRILMLTLVITFISGANFFSVLLFWPTQSYNEYGHDPTAVGIRNIPLGFSILAGAVIVLALLTYTRGHIRGLMLGSCIFMTAGGGAMAALRTDNIWLVYIVLTIAGLGIGGIVVPASIITNIICPDELIATVTALTLAIRVLGGAIGYSVYYNVFAEKFKYAATELILVPTAAVTLQTTDPEMLTKVVEITVAGLLDLFYEFPNITDAQVQTLIHAGQESYAYAYPYVYYVSIAFGGLAWYDYGEANAQATGPTLLESRLAIAACSVAQVHEHMMLCKSAMSACQVGRAKMLKHVLTLCALFVPAALGDLCSIDGTTTVRADQATSTIPCKTFTGSIAVATDAESAFFLRGVEEIQGTLEVSVQRINYLDLGELQKVDRFHVVATGITDMAYRNLHTVKDLDWDSVPMEGNNGNPQIKHVDRLSLVFTGIKDLGEIVDLETVDFIHVANNSAMMNVTLPNLKTVTNRLEIRDNSVGATVSFPELEWAEKISVEQIGASSSWVAEWDGNFTTLDLPKLVEVRGDFNIKDNAKLGSVIAPLLTNMSCPDLRYTSKGISYSD
ncbi:putative mfs drug efflux protein [Neofusicoccum parvum UCRNP2]|uniref:Putative mfs drug efflux protein n=1 Tax=Botryosphaeria parva (strain UCR-NP2) TaxID=1287680 RepID=R1EIZ2_BOTPV|nr:putative mfs drug efflux protein [Neofusicoccum parvum UCRNP2]